ncbi:phosphatase PAP2 family protein [Lysinibacillus sp. BW-2-10]|uniref:phosphatase PAP2 family protein n=1 Tax=Lysinibacillus sp. BW-2-10 TaxID=2590030 RepID=UPI00117E28CD|nr:phosphatase PAP2 family protein [Lysinibacillus sp. BW-2-10]TSI05078.1 phosphatase PAP2 family protein [Lysinibacillus sp. BW-2-10]
MMKWYYGLAIFTFLGFCILWMTYETSFIEAFDKQLADVLYGNQFIAMFHHIGETKFIFFIGIVLIVFIWLRLRDYKLMLFVMMTVGFGYVLYQFLKRVIGRPRPDIVDQFSTFSFPSGHALHGMLYLLTIAYVLNRLIVFKKVGLLIWLVAILLFLLVGLSRVAEARHYASDVFAGWMLGYSWFMLSVLWYESGNSKCGVVRDPH